MKAVVFIVTRTTPLSTAVLLVSETQDKCNGMIDGHVQFRCQKEGAILLRDIPYQPAPVPEGTMVRVGGSSGAPELALADPVVCCTLRDVALIEMDGSRTVYRVTQHCVQ